MALGLLTVDFSLTLYGTQKLLILEKENNRIYFVFYSVS